MERIFIDIGTSTVKVYKLEDKALNLIRTESIFFNKNFSEKTGISEFNKNKLYKIIYHFRDKYPPDKIQIYATHLFRSLSDEAKNSLVTEFELKTNIQVNILTQQEENYYLHKALIGKYHGNLPVLIINIGGGSTELVVVKNNSPIEKHNIEIGVGTILEIFPEINKEVSDVSIMKVKNHIKKFLTDLEYKTKVCIYTGGELQYMRRLNYPVEHNKVFLDPQHPYMITFNKYSNYNKNIYHKITMKELKSSMPDNPDWMTGSRACSVIAEAICEKHDIKIIIPSDSNLIDGIVRDEY